MAMEDAIAVVVSDGEERGVRPQRRTRKPSAKIRQNEGSQDSLDTTLLSSKKLPGSASRGTATNGAQTGNNIEDEQATLQTLQK